MLWLLFGQRLGHTGYGSYWEQLQMHLNLTPFRTIGEFLAAMRPDGMGNPHFSGFAFVNLAGNIVMFVPLGFFIPALWPKLRCLGRFLRCVAVTIIAVELIQLFTLLGSCDVDDLLLNVVGAAMGFGLYRLTFTIHRKLASRVIKQ